MGLPRLSQRFSEALGLYPLMLRGMCGSRDRTMVDQMQGKRLKPPDYLSSPWFLTSITGKLMNLLRNPLLKEDSWRTDSVSNANQIQILPLHPQLHPTQSPLGKPLDRTSRQHCLEGSIAFLFGRERKEFPFWYQRWTSRSLESIRQLRLRLPSI